MTHVPIHAPSNPRTSLAEPEAEPTPRYAVAEFFAGIGLARIGFERAAVGFKVTWANDIEADKQKMHLGHFGHADDCHYIVQDIKLVAADIEAAEVPRNLSLAWASFPCTDLSLAGGRNGLAGAQSGTFWDFMDVLERLGADKPPVVTLENVNGLATSHKGDDIRAAIRRLNELGYSVDVLTLDARRWVPQSRPRLFLIASVDKPAEAQHLQPELRPTWLDPILDDPELNTHRARLPSLPPLHTDGWTKLVKKIPPHDEDQWWDEARTAKFSGELSTIQQKRIKDLAESDDVVYRTAYRRTRNGKPAWEIRPDDIAGCLRTARGGSSKQAVVRIEKGHSLRVRWMTPREYAHLMGAGDYVLPPRRSQAIMGFGDAVCVDAVEWLAENYLEPLLSGKLLESESKRTKLGQADCSIREGVKLDARQRMDIKSPLEVAVDEPANAVPVPTVSC